MSSPFPSGSPATRALLVSIAAWVVVAAAGGGAWAQTFSLRPGISAEPVDDPVAPAPVKAEEDPYEALGIRAGSFILYPSLTLTGGYTTNASASADGTPSTFAEAQPELLIQSDWDRHEATLTLRGGYETFFDDASADDPSGSADATARIDFANAWTGDLAAGVSYKHEDISDPAFPDGADTPPGVTELTSSAALNGTFGRGTFTLAGNVDRTLYEDTTSLGAPVDQGDRINTVFGGRLRLGYQATPSLTPFVEGAIARRVYDQTLDDDGLARSSTATSLRAGVAFDHGPLLTGEIAVGTTEENFDDASLAALRALTIDGSLVWSPTELTTVTFDASTTLNPSVDIASSGSATHDASVEVAYAWRDNVTFNSTASISREDYQGTGEVDDTYDVGAGVTWKLNRMLQLTAGYTHEWLVSTDPAAEYASDTVKVELRAQR